MKAHNFCLCSNIQANKTESSVDLSKEIKLAERLLQTNNCNHETPKTDNTTVLPNHTLNNSNHNVSSLIGEVDMKANEKPESNSTKDLQNGVLSLKEVFEQCSR